MRMFLAWWNAVGALAIIIMQIAIFYRSRQVFRLYKQACDALLERVKRLERLTGYAIPEPPEGN